MADSSDHRDNYQRPWGTLAAHRSELGHIPLNVDPSSGAISGENAAGVDANLWFVIGQGVHFRATGDTDFLREQWPAIEANLDWTAPT